MDLNPHLFHPDAIDAETKALNALIVAKMEGMPDWWIVGAETVREARRQGKGPFPLAPTSPRATMRMIDGPDGSQIPIRIITAANPRGVYLHLHGGGWTIGACDQQDPMMERIADNCGLTVISVEYRLAPEHPYPAGVDDCEAVAVWLAKSAKAEFGSNILTIGGESAGGHLTAATVLRMRDKHGYAGFAGANLVFGAFDLAMTPSQRRYGDTRLVLRTLDIGKFADAFVPAPLDRRDPAISPLYADLSGLCPALFTIGTSDALVDDTLFMYGRWVAAGNPAELAVYPGGAHGFTSFPGKLADSARARMDAFLNKVTAA